MPRANNVRPYGTSLYPRGRKLYPWGITYDPCPPIYDDRGTSSYPCPISLEDTGRTFGGRGMNLYRWGSMYDTGIYSFLRLWLGVRVERKNASARGAQKART